MYQELVGRLQTIRKVKYSLTTDENPENHFCMDIFKLWSNGSFGLTILNVWIDSFMMNNLFYLLV